MDDRARQQWCLKEKLRHTWEAFFARFGRFTEIQMQGIPPLLDGNNCVLVSATASGKTEAALAPLLESFKKNSSPVDGISILYLVPTRALARDLARRLEQPLEKLALRVRVKTGDEAALNSSRLPALLITTPESLDSLLANHPRFLKDIRAVVIDELHIFDNTPRGDQLRILLNRLRRLKRYAVSCGDAASESIQYCAISATLTDPTAVALRYFDHPKLIAVTGHRLIDAEIQELQGTSTLEAVFAHCRARGIKKILAFCQSRAECEQWAFDLEHKTPFGNQVYVHHASLDAKVRRAVEKNFAQAETALCFATSTLELGIDIGDVDLILLIGAPSNLSAFLQRIGRGNRRTGCTSVIGFYRTELEQSLFRIFVRTAQAPDSPTQPVLYFFRASIVAQQLFSYLKQTRYGELDVEIAYSLFAELNGQPLISKTSYDRIIEHLIERNYFIATSQHLVKPGPVWNELYEQRGIYSNLTGLQRSVIDVMDQETGRKIGEIERAIDPGGAFLLGGKARQSTRLNGRRLIVKAIGKADRTASPHLRSAWQPMNRELAQLAAQELKIPQAENSDDLAFVTDSPETDQSLAPTTWLFHCAGDAYGLILGDLLETQYRVRVEDYNNLYLAIKGVLPISRLDFTEAQISACLRRRWKQLESWFELGSFQKELPTAIRREIVNEAFNPTEFQKHFQGRCFSPAAIDEVF